jgi:4-hydroxy-tetrahydrodipicolinate synthase
VRLAMDGASFPVAAKDMAIMRGQAAGKPYLPNLPTPEGASYDKMKKEMEKAGLI